MAHNKNPSPRCELQPLHITSNDLRTMRAMAARAGQLSTHQENRDRQANPLPEARDHGLDEG